MQPPPKRKKREPIGCLVRFDGCYPCKSPFFGGRCGTCGGTVCAQHFIRHRNECQRLAALRAAAAGSGLSRPPG